MRTRFILAGCALLLGPLPIYAAPPSSTAGGTTLSLRAAWVRRSDRNAQLVLNRLAPFNPVGFSRMGVTRVDDQIPDLTVGHEERQKAANAAVLQLLRSRLAAERDLRVRQDLQVLIRWVELDTRSIDLNRKYLLPYVDLPEAIFSGLHGLLDDQVAPERRPAALARLRKYAGMEPGYPPAVQLAEAWTRERLSETGLLGPSKVELERNLADAPVLIEGMGKLFEKYHLAGCEAPYVRLKEQLAAYDQFVKQQVMPRARTDFRLPPALYALRLEQAGIDIPPARLARMARTAFKQIQGQMQALAPQVSREHGWSFTDYRDVIQALKRQQLAGDAVLPLYQRRLGQIEAIIRKEKLVTLPARPARIRLATPAESAATPIAHFQAPRLVGNTGEQGVFVLPLSIPAPPGSAQATQRMDDFTCAAAAWDLTAHEARPGHELQFSTMIETGVPLARAIFAGNSTNAEGWGLYAESIIEPFMPPDGRMMTLWGRLLRAARAFSDPELQAGQTTPEQVRQLLKQQVVTSDALANEEVQRYTFMAPGQAPSYFYGYTKLVQLRDEVKRLQGSQFSRMKFHDAVLAQGLLPPALVRQGVLANLGLKQ